MACRKMLLKLERQGHNPYRHRAALLTIIYEIGKFLRFATLPIPFTKGWNNWYHFKLSMFVKILYYRDLFKYLASHILSKC